MRIPIAVSIFLTILLLIFQISAGETLYPLGYDLNSRYLVNSNTIAIGDTLIINRTIANHESFSITGLYFSENLPPQFEVASVTMKINGSDIGYKRHGPVLSLIRASYDNYVWEIDAPADNTINTVLNPGDSVQFQLKLSCDIPGIYLLPLHTTVFYSNNQGFLSTSDSIQIEIVSSSGTDTTPPQFVEACPSNLTAECNNIPAALVMTATDNYDINVYVVFNEVTNGNIITRTWTATDNAGNSVQCVQTITVLDTTPPVIACANNMIINCGMSIDPEFTGYPAVTDNCSGSPALSYSDVQQNNVITRTWTATDNAGNSVQCVQTITVLDTTPPVIACANNIVVNCGSSIDPASTGYPTATDNCGGSPVLTYSDVQQNNVITRTWTATDNAGNSAQCVQTLTILDTTRPVIACPNNKVVSCGMSIDPEFTGYPTATDNCTGSPALSYNDIQQNNVITRTWTATDNAGNSAQCVQTLTILDTTRPVIACPNNKVVSCGMSIDPEFTGYPTVTDNCDESVALSYKDIKYDNIIRRYWTATDNAGNSAQCVQTFIVSDATPPTIACPDNFVVNCGSSIDPESTGYPTATDNCSENVALSYNDIQQANIITRTWTATDNVGNSAQCVQTITISDTSSLVISCPGNLVVNCGSPTDPQSTGYPTVIENCSDSTILTYSDVQQGNIITRTWTATDNAGNSAQCVQTITVLDTTPPTIACPGNLVVSCGSSIDPESTGYPTATDNCNGNVTLSYNDIQQANIITRTWTATDNAGNSAQCLQTITVLDTTPPQFTGGCPPNMTVECDAIPDPPVVTATDNCDPDVNIAFNELVGSNDITRTWTATDNAGNSAQCIQTIIISDNTPPEFVSNCPDNITVAPDAIPNPPIMTAIDNCDPNVDIVFDEVIGNNIITRTWTATDDAGNSAGCTQTIYIDIGTQVLSGISGQVMADGIGLYNAEVRLFNSAGNLLTDIAADKYGYYSFSDVPEGSYMVVLTPPFGFTPVTDTLVDVMVEGYDVDVYFDLTSQVVTYWYYNWWWWKNQFTYIQRGGYYLSRVEVTPDEFEALSQAIFDHIYDRDDGFEIQVDSVTYIGNPPRPITFEELSAIYLGAYSSSIDASVKRSLSANLLNIASGKLSQYDIVSFDGATASQTLTYLTNLYLTGGSYDKYVVAVNLQRMHMRIMISAGVIPLTTPNIVYKENDEADSETGLLPNEFVLYQNMPNPFNPITEIKFYLPRASNVRLEIYNIIGQKIATLVDDRYSAGNHTAIWDASGSGSGIYFYRLEADGFRDSKKMVLLK